MRLHGHMHDADCYTRNTECQVQNEILPNTLLKGPRQSDLKRFTMFGWIAFVFLRSKDGSLHKLNTSA